MLLRAQPVERSRSACSRLPCGDCPLLSSSWRRRGCAAARSVLRCADAVPRVARRLQVCTSGRLFAGMEVRLLDEDGGLVDAPEQLLDGKRSTSRVGEITIRGAARANAVSTEPHLNSCRIRRRNAPGRSHRL